MNPHIYGCLYYIFICKRKRKNTQNLIVESISMDLSLNGDEIDDHDYFSKINSASESSCRD